MKRSLRWCIGAVLGLAVGAAGPAKAGLVVNGNFGTGDFTGWTLSGDTSGPDYVSGTFPGPYAAALTTSVSDVFLSQALPLSTVVGQEYLFSFSLAGDGATPNTFSASLGGTTLLSLSDVPNTLPSGTSYSFDFTASSSSSALQFDVRDDSGYLYLTNVSVNAVVPEPPTAASAGLGALMLIGYFWRKHRKSNEG